MRKSNVGTVAGLAALVAVVFAAQPSQGNAAVVSYNFLGKVVSETRQGNFGPYMFGNRIGELVRFTAQFDPSRAMTVLENGLAGPGGGTASTANASLGATHLTEPELSEAIAQVSFLVATVTFADGTQFSPSARSQNNFGIFRSVTIFNDTFAPGETTRSDRLSIVQSGFVYNDPGYYNSSLEFTAHLSTSALASASFGEPVRFSDGDVATITLISEFTGYGFGSTAVINVFAVDAIPEPATHAMLLAGLAGLAVLSRRKHRSVLLS